MRRSLAVATAITIWFSAPYMQATAAGSEGKTVDPSCYGPTIESGVACLGEETDPEAAINTPTKYAWRVFAQINQPAFPGDKKDTRRVWETWKSTDDNSNPRDAIYLNNGHKPQRWDVQPRSAPLPKRLVPIQQLNFLREQNPQPSNFIVQFISNNPNAQEVRVNRPAFNFILENELYNRQGQYQYASTHPNFDFPVASKEVKAIWREASPSDTVSDYYSAKVGDKTYILVAMHIITKDLPFWHWASFVHKDKDKDPMSGYKAPLSSDQDIPASIKGTPFENYRLLAELVRTGTALTPTGKGAQINWITRTGLSTVMGNPQIEIGFEIKSSCITCHAHSSIGMTRDGTVRYSGFPLEVGAVHPNDFSNDGITYSPLDFVWSLTQAKDFKP